MKTPDMIPRTPPRLRPDSERALRPLRLVWLLGWTVPDIAACLQVGPAPSAAASRNTASTRPPRRASSTVSAPGLKPLDWALRAVRLAEIGGASQILAEANQGGDMVREVIAITGTTMPVRLVTARIGKKGRAQPIAAPYQPGRVHHYGTFRALEDQLCRFGTAEESGSPDRKHPRMGPLGPHGGRQGPAGRCDRVTWNPSPAGG